MHLKIYETDWPQELKILANRFLHAEMMEHKDSDPWDTKAFIDFINAARKIK